MSKSSFRWGIVSAGRISNDFCIGLRSDPDKAHEIVAVASRDLTKAKEFAEKHHIAKVYESYKEIANDPNIDCYYVGNITSHHYEVVMLLLNQSKNVLSEKPIGMNVRETKEMMALAEEKNVFLMEGLWSRFFPTYCRLREELKKKTIGDVRLVQVAFGLYSDRSDMDRITDPDLGGGTDLGIGIYIVALSQMIYGEMPQKVTAIGFLNDKGADVLDSITLQYSGNRMTSFVTTCIAAAPNEANICGSKGIIRLNKDFWSSDTIVINGKLEHHPLPQPVDKSFYDNGVGFLYEANEVKRCIEKGLKECPLVTHKDSIEFATIVETCRKMMGVEYKEDTISNMCF